MKERPILFSGPMVRALLAGGKTQTRRVVSPQPTVEKSPDGLWSAAWNRKYTFSAKTSGECLAYWCPYGQPGDRLWVREAWARTTVFSQDWIVYREGDNRTDYGGPWKPSIHMPRAASRITLEITCVRLERLHEISDADALAEGITAQSNGRYPCQFDDGKVECLSPVTAYASLWSSINGADSWAANPWVWVVEFKVVRP